ncbi:cell envelope integrity EipB family protein [Bartonella machadoae]|uniref:cell envelope integrity EipB family protein n=1 Tax=Bartonella machadoae TaxID=2893471 RepID=UPI001F4C6BCA|nr:cell envelope integrity EipB family protein [Bartonella machadoae]UNE54744.1 cell envelope integrity EipB family protein [Bartonella machadoae]
MMRLLLIIILYIACFDTAKAEESIFIAPHRAIYDFRLDSVSHEMTISGMSGRMVYELTGSSCQGYTTRFRFISRIHSEDMPVRLTDQQTTSYETGDSRTFHFNVIDQVGEEVTHRAEGVAERIQDGIIVKLKKPKEKEYKLAIAEFPIMQLKNIIRHAKAGSHFYHVNVFDGTDKADKVIKESIVIGEKKTRLSDNEAKKMGKLGEEEYWPVTISYFDDIEKKDGLPVYRTSFLLYENGVMRDLHVDYGTFSVRAKLNSLEFLESEKDMNQCEY